MLFSDEGPRADAIRLCAFISQYYKSLGHEEHVEISFDSLITLVRKIRETFPYQGGYGNASPFKKVGQFVCYFVAQRPISTSLPSGMLIDLGRQEPIARTNAIVALIIAIESLHNATVTWEDGTNHRLENIIDLSKHSFVDIADALTNIVPRDHFKLVSVLFEQMAYKTNPHCQYSIP